MARVYPADDHQAAALAALAVELGGHRRVAVLHDGDVLYGRALADRFARTAQSLGAPTVVARRRFDPEAREYQGQLAAAVARERPDAVFIGGLLNLNGAAVLRARPSCCRPGDRKILLGQPLQRRHRDRPCEAEPRGRGRRSTTETGA